MSKLVKFYDYLSCFFKTHLQRFLFSAGMLFIVGSHVYAQEASESKQNIERIVVSGQNADVALRAFNSGNYSLAEIEFKENAECALRAEINEADYLDSFQSEQTNQLEQAESQPQPLNNTPDTANIIANASNTVTYTPSSGVNQASQTSVRERSCENRGFQIYMTGMSQLKLGRAEEAEKNFEHAIKIDKFLYDAHFRLALIKLLREDKDGAMEHLSSLDSVLKRCHRCDFRHKIESHKKFLEHAIRGKIKLN